MVLAGAGGGGERELGVGGGGVAGSGVGPGAEDQDDGLVQRAAPGVAFAAGVAFGAAVVGAGGAELAEGDRVAAGFGQEVAAVAEHVRPLPEPRRRRWRLPPSCQAVVIIRSVVGRAAQVLDVGLRAGAAGRARRGR